MRIEFPMRKRTRQRLVLAVEGVAYMVILIGVFALLAALPEVPR